MLPDKFRVWIEARKRHRLSHTHVQMARELGMNPKKLGKLDNHKREPWKAPLPVFIEACYVKRFKKDRPDQVHSIEDIIKIDAQKRAAKKQNKQIRCDAAK